MLDPHCHLDDPQLASHSDQCQQLAFQAGIRSVLIPSFGPERWPYQTQLLAHPSPLRLYAGFGWHPWALSPELTLKDYEDQLLLGWSCHAHRWGDQLRGIGEFGLDRSPRVKLISPDIQEAVFRLHQKWAAKLKLPLILHVVRSHDRALALLRQSPPRHGGVVHGFTSHPQIMASYLELGLDISFGPDVLRPGKARTALKVAPLNRFIFETDAPMALSRHPSLPPPFGPHHLRKILTVASQVLGKSVEYLISQHQETCARIFKIKPTEEIPHP